MFLTRRRMRWVMSKIRLTAITIVLAALALFWAVGCGGGTPAGSGNAGTSGGSGGGGGCSVAGAPSLGWAGVGMFLAAMLMRCRARRRA